MQVNSVDNTHFGAKLISPAKIKYKAGKYWKDFDVSFIKFETNKVEDRTKLDAVNYLWGGKNLSASIAEEANILGGKSNVYGLTLQQSNFEHVLPDHILGLVTTSKVRKGDSDIEIFKIGTNPKYAYEQNRRTRDIKHIAVAMLDALRDYTGRKDAPRLYVHYADPKEMKFLTRVGVETQTNDAVEIISK